MPSVSAGAKVCGGPGTGKTHLLHAERLWSVIAGRTFDSSRSARATLSYVRCF